MDWLTSPLVAVILAALLAFVGGLLSILVNQLIKKIEIIDTRMSTFVSREEIDTKIERVRVEIDKQVIRQEDRITKRLDTISRHLEEFRIWMTERMDSKANKDDISH